MLILSAVNYAADHYVDHQFLIYTKTIIIGQSLHLKKQWISYRLWYFHPRRISPTKNSCRERRNTWFRNRPSRTNLQWLGIRRYST